MEGRLTEKQMNNFRQECDGEGLSSYPHPHLMAISGSSQRFLWA